jgi:hypothetical protein
MMMRNIDKSGAGGKFNHRIGSTPFGIVVILLGLTPKYSVIAKAVLGEMLTILSMHFSGSGKAKLLVFRNVFCGPWSQNTSIALVKGRNNAG